MKNRIEHIELIEDGEERVFLIKEDGVERILRVKREEDCIYPINKERSDFCILDGISPKYRRNDID